MSPTPDPSLFSDDILCLIKIFKEGIDTMSTIYKGKRYAKVLPDGSIDIVTSVLKTAKNTYYHPDEKLCARFGYSLIVEDDDLIEEDGYKIVDEGLRVVERDGKKVVRHEGRKLKIVDNGPQPGPGQEVKKDYWKEIDGEWRHVYKYRSVSRHITPTKFDPPDEKKEETVEEPKAEVAPEEPAPTAQEEQTPAEQVEQPAAEEATPEAAPGETTPAEGEPAADAQ